MGCNSRSEPTSDHACIIWINQSATPKCFNAVSSRSPQHRTHPKAYTNDTNSHINQRSRGLVATSYLLIYALRAYFLVGKWMSRLRCFSVFSDRSCYKHKSTKESVLFDPLLNGQQRERKAKHLCQSTADSTSFLCTQVQWNVLLVLVVFPQVLACFLVRDGQNTGDGFSNGGATGTEIE